jgi:hypothetical protein
MEVSKFLFSDRQQSAISRQSLLSGLGKGKIIADRQFHGSIPDGRLISNE